MIIMSEHSDPLASRNAAQSQQTLDVIVYLAMVSSGVILALFIFAFGAWAWLLRDELGPNSVTTHGSAAIIQTFWHWHFGPISLALTAIYSILVYGQLRFGRRSNTK